VCFAFCSQIYISFSLCVKKYLLASVSSPPISDSPQKTYGLTHNLSHLPFICTVVKYIRLFVVLVHDKIAIYMQNIHP